jgi:hypothetical protein
MKDAKFLGQWKFVDKCIHDLPEAAANKALMELGLYFRTLDDKHDLTGWWKKAGPSVGTLFLSSGNTEPLSPREMSNKIIHAVSVEWEFLPEPVIKCTGGATEKWVRAEIVVSELIGLGGRLEANRLRRSPVIGGAKPFPHFVRAFGNV